MPIGGARIANPARTSAIANRPFATPTLIFQGDAEVGTIEGVGDPHLFRSGAQWAILLGCGDDAGGIVNMYSATLTAGLNLDAAASSWTIDTTKISPAAGVYNAFGFETPSLVSLGSVHRIYYTAVAGGGTPGTDEFTMSYLQLNGSTWEDAGAAVLIGTAAYELWTDVSFVSECSVNWFNGRYHAFYTAGVNLITAYANSSDGITWGNKVQVFPLNNFLWSPCVYQVGKHWEMIIATVSINTPSSGLYRLRSRTIEGGGQWVDSHQIVSVQDSRWSSQYAYGATVGMLPNGNIAVYYTGRDNVGGATKPNVLRTIIAPMKDF